MYHRPRQTNAPEYRDCSGWSSYFIIHAPVVTNATNFNLVEPLALHRRARVAHLFMGSDPLCGAPNKHFRLFQKATRPGKVVPVSVTDLPLCNRCGRLWLAMQKAAIRHNRSIQLRHHAERRQVLSMVPAGQTPMRDLFPTKVLS